MGLLFENGLTECTVTESKCSRITQHLELHTARRRPISNHIIGGVDTIKAYTYSDCVIAVMILEDVGIQLGIEL